MSDFNATHKTVVIVAFLASLVALAFTGRDYAALLAIGTAILAGLGITMTQTNGTQKKMLEMLENQSTLLANMQPPQKETDAAPK